MFNWLRELFELRYEYRARKLRLQSELENDRNLIEQDNLKCESCEVLKIALERSNLEKDRLMERLFQNNLPSDITNQKPQEIPKPIMPRNIPWHVRQQILEREDREKARLMREAPKSDTEELERELGINAGSAGSKNSSSV